MRSIDYPVKVIRVVDMNSKEHWNGGKEWRENSTLHQSRFYFLLVVGMKLKEHWAGSNDCSRNSAGYRCTFFLVVGNSRQ